jgi:protoheme IX farnesyltransferase
VVLAVVMFLWTPPHFWSLAAAKSNDYVQAGIPMLPNTASQRVWTLAVLLHTAALFAISLIPLWYGQGLVYGLGAGLGGAYFLWTGIKLYMAPGKQTAMANFFASLIQLTLLIVGVVFDPLIRIAG